MVHLTYPCRVGPRQPARGAGPTGTRMRAVAITRANPLYGGTEGGMPASHYNVAIRPGRDRPARRRTMTQLFLIGMVGLGVMVRNFALNIAYHCFSVG